VSQARGWSGGGTATTLVLVRHGATAHSVEKRFSGGITGANPPLSPAGIAQVEATADWLAAREDIDVVVTSPVRRTRESAAILARRLGAEIAEVVDGMAEMDFGSWDGFTFAELMAQHQDDLTAWLADHGVAAGGGESFRQVQERVLAARDQLLEKYAGATIVVLTHVSPIKILVADAVGAELDALYRMELTAASVTTVAYYSGDGQLRPSLRLFNAVP
jgi:ribonuclease H / adenosylcobalamin/alpha-ribazole phosphatase